MYELTHELPNDLRPRILGNKEISWNCLDLMASTLLKDKFWHLR